MKIAENRLNYWLESNIFDQKFIIQKTGGSKTSEKKLAGNKQNFCRIRYAHIFVDQKLFPKTTNKRR